jgi:hypothetical protein
MGVSILSMFSDGFAKLDKGKCECYSLRGLVFDPHPFRENSDCSNPRRDFAMLLIKLTGICGLGEA